MEEEVVYDIQQEPVERDGEGTALGIIFVMGY